NTLRPPRTILYNKELCNQHGAAWTHAGCQLSDSAAAERHRDATRRIAGTARRLIQSNSKSGGHYVYWRAEGSLLELTAVRPVAFFTWNAQTFTERWVRRGLVLAIAALRPLLYLSNRSFATRVVY